MIPEKKGTVSDCISIGGKPWGRASKSPDETNFKCIFKDRDAVKKIEKIIVFNDEKEDKIQRAIAVARRYRDRYAFDTTRTTVDRWMKTMNDQKVKVDTKKVGNVRVTIYELD